MKFIRLLLCFVVIAFLPIACGFGNPTPLVTPTQKQSQECPFQTVAQTGEPPSELYGKTALQNVSSTNGDFTFDFWLYCDISLTLKDNTHYSAIPHLGIYSAWKYTGPKVNGHTTDFWGFEPDVKPANSWDGPLYKAASHFKSGISLTEDSATKLIQTQTPFRYQVRVESPQGKYGAVFSFTIQMAEAKYVISKIDVELLP